MSRAIDYIDLIALDLNYTPQGAVLQLRAPNPPPWNDKLETALVDAEVIVPESLIVEIDAAYFNVHAEGPFKGMLIPSSLGRLEVSDVHGRLDIATANRRVWVSNVSGDISVGTTNSTLTAEDVSCLGLPAKFRNEGGEIRISNIAGGINVRNSFGRIEIEGFLPSGKSNFVRGQSGPIVIGIDELSDARIVVNNRYEDIELALPKDFSAAMSLAVDEDGRIEATGFPFSTDLVERNRLNLVAGKGDATVSASIRGKGNIWVRGVDKGE